MACTMPCHHGLGFSRPCIESSLEAHLVWESKSVTVVVIIMHICLEFIVLVIIIVFYGGEIIQGNQRHKASWFTASEPTQPHAQRCAAT